jgi:hypothetical protein
VEVGGFLGDRIDANNRTSLQAGLRTPIPTAFEAISRGQKPPEECKRLATDSDFFKWLEGACYAIAYEPESAGLAEEVAKYVEMILATQEESGFLGTRLSPDRPFEPKTAHDLYVAGHLTEAAVAHFKATGSRKLLDAAIKLVEFYMDALEEGHVYFEETAPRDHPEIEVALARLYRVTGDKRFLDFADTVVDFYHVGPTVAELKTGAGDRHAVRTCYLLAGMAELYMVTGEEEYYESLPPLWEDMVDTRMYVTGGIGYHEKLPIHPYDLPQYLPNNAWGDIAETCASVSLMMWSWRMHGLTGESKYFDLIERVLYNHYLGAIAHDHLGNFYYNPIRLVGDVSPHKDAGQEPGHRTRIPEIHQTTCCLPNSWRFFGQLPELMFSTNENTILINLYSTSATQISLEKVGSTRVEVQTRYPDEGDVSIQVRPENAGEFTLALRIPAWCEDATVRVNQGDTESGQSGVYHEIKRTWKAGDTVQLRLPMKPRVIQTRFEVPFNRGQVAFQRGPLIYCLENEDAGDLPLEQAVVLLDRDNLDASAEAKRDAKLGLHLLEIDVGRRPTRPTWDGLYWKVDSLQPEEVRKVALIPFYYRANRNLDSRWLTFIPYVTVP